MISIKRLNKKFGDRVLFNDFNLEINDGEFVVFSGESGAGKTTLLNIIGGLEPYESGEVISEGIDLSKRKDKNIYFGEKVGFLFQNFALMEDSTVRQNLELIKGKNRSDISIEDALRYVGLVDKIDSKVYTLSGGEQQRIALARLMIKKCNVILADEPTGSLDTKNSYKVISILSALNKSGKTIIMVTHDERLKSVGTRLVNLSHSVNE